LDNHEQLQLIRDAHGNPALLALATVDLTFPDIPDGERKSLRSALEVAAIPHWCDSAILAALIDSGLLSHTQWMRLKELPVVEPFPARGSDAINVHEASRLAIRKHMTQTQMEKFIEFSTRAARVFEGDRRPIGQIEWTYHLLVAEPERGAVALETLDRAWWGTAHHEDLAALSVALTELDTSQVLRGRALVRARLVVAQRQVDIASAASLGDLANQLLQAAQAIDDTQLIGDAYWLVGDVAQARGDLAAASRAYTQCLAIYQQLAALDPTNTGWQEELAAAYSGVGDMAQARDDLAAAEHAYTQELAISKELAAVDSTNTSWQRALAAAYGRVGDVAQARGDLAAAEQAYRQCLAISRELAAVDPTNTSWQRALADAHGLTGDAARARGDLAAAEQAYAQDLVISEQLAALDPTNTRWQQALAVAHNRVGKIVQARGDLAAAEQEYAHDLAISQRLAVKDPTNTGWQEALASAHSRVVDITRGNPHPMHEDPNSGIDN
jgi:tetratricopeptide (TPR) repeat protein